MTARVRLGLALVVAAMAAAPSRAAAADGAKDGKTPPSTVVKTHDGLRFNLPADWPVEKRDGAVGPIPIEEYLARKFSALDARLRALEQQIGSLDVRMRVLEESGKPRSAARSLEATNP